MVVILMGVSGSGKTTLGLRLAGDLGWTFIDADDFHSPQSLRKLTAGEPLGDGEIGEWTAALREQVAAVVARGENAVLAHSSLNSGSRRQLVVDPGAVRFVHLKGSASLVRQRLRARSGYFLAESTLARQFATLDAPADAVTIDIDERPGRIVEQIRQALSI